MDIPKKSLEQVITEDLLYLRKTKNLKVEFGYSEFSKWYTLHSGKSILQTASIKYHYGEDATFFRDIGDKISILRNQTIVKRIETMLNQYSNVMIVYGASHLLEEMPALESALGKPKYYKLY